MPLVFAHASRAASSANKSLMTELLAFVAQFARVEIESLALPSYQALAARVDRGEVDVAWLPPISFILLHERGKVVPLVNSHRGGRAEFHSVILVRRASTIRSPADLRGTRAAWVDKHSASGYVLPRIHLAATGIDPRTSFASERFYESHEAVVRAVVGGGADFGATYARLDRSGEPARGAWMDLPGAEGAVRVVVTYGALPSDVIAARPGLGEDMCEALRGAFIKAAFDVRGSLVLRDLFGVDEFRPWHDAGYTELRKAMFRAAADGLLESPPAR